MSKLPSHVVLRAVMHGMIADFEQLCLNNMESIDVKQAGNNRTAMHYAAMAGYTKVIEILHRLGSKSLDAADVFGDTPMHYAAKEGHVAVVELLFKLESKASRMKSIYGSTPLYLAVLTDRINVIEFFCKHERDLIANGDTISNSLMWTASVLWNFGVVLLLHRYGSQFCAAEDRAEEKSQHSKVADRAIILYYSRSLMEVLFFVE
jgi:ankyrin repeat protein